MPRANALKEKDSNGCPSQVFNASRLPYIVNKCMGLVKSTPIPMNIIKLRLNSIHKAGISFSTNPFTFSQATPDLGGL